MLTLKLSTLTKPELPEIPLGLLSTTGNTVEAKLAGARAVLPLPTPTAKDDNLTALMDALSGVEQFCSKARKLADQTQEHQLNYKRRAELAEAEKTHLEHEANRLRAQLESLEQRVPRWVRRLFGATPTV